jgi:hypothetical protein
MRRATCGIVICLGLFGVLTANAQRPAVLYYDGEDALWEPLTIYLGELTANGFSVTTTDDTDAFRRMYLSNVYSLAVALDSDAGHLEYWNTDVPEQMGLITVAADGEGCYVNMARMLMFMLDQHHPSPTPGANAEADKDANEDAPPDPNSPQTLHYVGWLQKLMDCTNGGMNTFMSSIPDDMKVLWNMEVQTTPPSASIRMGGEATGDQLRPLARNLLQFNACLFGCVI